MYKKVIAGNWKMNKLPNEAIEFIERLVPLVQNTQNEVILCVPFTNLFYASLIAQGTNIKIGAQNMHWEDNGAYTGEISGKMLQSIGVEYVIIGHSERREYFYETDEMIAKKIKKALECELKPIICVGENLKQKEDDQTKEIVMIQTKLALERLTKEQIKSIIIAYEPIWAIGTGKVATVEEANATIETIREQIEIQFGKEEAEDITILYGGSVKSNNAKEFFSMKNIDGALVGGASLDAEEFAKIIN